jgi:phage tail-like protein
MPPVGQRDDPFRGFNFRLEIDGSSVAGFREASGLTFTTAPVEYREGTDVPLHARKLTGLRSFANISLRRGITQNRELWTWYLDVLNGQVERRTGAIVLQDEQHNDVLRWNFEGGWISRWEGPTLNATSNDVAIEAIEITVERVELAA